MATVKKKFSIKDYKWATPLELGQSSGQQPNPSEAKVEPSEVTEAPPSTVTEQDLVPTPPSTVTGNDFVPTLTGNDLVPTVSDFLGSIVANPSEQARTLSPTDLLTDASRRWFWDIETVIETMQARENEGRLLREIVEAQEKEGRELRGILGLAEGEDVIPSVQGLLIQATCLEAKLDLTERDFEMECHLNKPLRTLLVEAQQKVGDMSRTMEDLRNILKELQISSDAKDANLRHLESLLEAEREKVATLLRMAAFLSN